MTFINEVHLNSLVRLLAGQHSKFFRTEVYYGTKALLCRTLKLPESPVRSSVAIVGCAAGEEPYSLMMALDLAGLRSKVNLLAIDSDPQILIKAQRAVYDFSEYGGRLEMMETIPAGHQKYFMPLSDVEEIFTISPSIKKGVQFKLADAAAADFSQRVPQQNVIIINNVLVHATDDQRRTIINNLLDRLVPGGRLIVNERIAHPRLEFWAREGSVFCYTYRP